MALPRNDLRFRFAAFRELRTAPRVQADIRRRLEQIAAGCGPGYVVSMTTAPRNRARGVVITTTRAAQADNARRNTLLRNLSRGAL